MITLIRRDGLIGSKVLTEKGYQRSTPLSLQYLHHQGNSDSQMLLQAVYPQSRFMSYLLRLLQSTYCAIFWDFNNALGSKPPEVTQVHTQSVLGKSNVGREVPAFFGYNPRKHLSEICLGCDGFVRLCLTLFINYNLNRKQP